MGRVGALLAAVVAALLLAAGSAAADVQPNDPSWGADWAQHLLRMPTVWGMTTGDPSVIVATVDSGVDPSVPDLRDQLVPGWDFIQNDAVPRDTVGHGTHLASIIAGVGNDGGGMAGYCWRCKLMPIRVTADGAAGADIIARGINYAVDHGARIIVMGLNAPGPTDPVEALAVKAAADRGVLVFASAGNTGTTDLRYPAAYPGAIAVAATNDTDQLYFWSTRGDWVQLAAPGCDIVFDPAIGPGTLCGTSFTPAVAAGIAALILSLNPSLTTYQVRDALLSSAVKISGINSGGGRIDPLAAIAKLGLAPPPAPVKPAPVPTVVTTTQTKAGGTKTTPAAKTGTTTKTSGRQLFARTSELMFGVMRRDITRTLDLGRGRIELQAQAARAHECSLALISPTGTRDLALPGDPTLLGLTEIVPAGRYTLQLTCAPARRRSYTLSVVAQRPVASARPGR